MGGMKLPGGGKLIVPSDGKHGRRTAKSPSIPTFPWCCPKCLKRGKATLEKVLLAPAAAAPAGKRKR